MKSNSTAVALPARTSLAPGALDDLQIAVLSFPFLKEVYDFRAAVAEARRIDKTRIAVPFRRLNNSLLACAPTLTYGFERTNDAEGNYQRQALVVGKTGSLKHPSATQIHVLISIWATNWAAEFRRKDNKEVDSVCDSFLRGIAQTPKGWDWKRVPASEFERNINAENGVGYKAIPSLLATLLHGEEIRIEGLQKTLSIRWRKAQGRIAGGNLGLFLVSQPVKAGYMDRYGNLKEGYFAYKLEFAIQTQAGRYNGSMLLPWIYLKLSCQRYGDEPLKHSNFQRDISVFLGMNEERLAGFEVDSTLVRLPVDHRNNTGKGEWQDHLAEILQEFKARPLAEPTQLLTDPTVYGNFEDRADWRKDEYYLIHAEGYLYGNTRGHKHNIHTGYSFREQGEIIAAVLKLLETRLIPDGPFGPDIPAPSGVKKPLAMYDYDAVARIARTTKAEREQLGLEAISERKTAAHLKQQAIVNSALARALSGKPMRLFVFWHEHATYLAVMKYLREVFRLADGEDFPSSIELTTILIDDPNLLEPLRVEEADKKQRGKFIRQQHELKRNAWRRFLKAAIPVNPKSDSCFALIEIGGEVRDEQHFRSIKGAVREACAWENITSQFLRTVKDKVKIAEDGSSSLEHTSATKGRVQNAVLDATVRQAGAMYGTPNEIYRHAKIPPILAENMDVVALCRLRKTRDFGDIYYALAVRLRAGGTVDVLLPNETEWIPYTQAAPKVGRIFAEERSNKAINGRRNIGKIKLSNGMLARFVEKVLTYSYETPTLALIEAEGWRNTRGESDDVVGWGQLQNAALLRKRNVLDFSQVAGITAVYGRAKEDLSNLLGVIRLRMGDETPQYIPGWSSWQDSSETRDFLNLSAFLDESVVELPHFFSAGRLPGTQKIQKNRWSRQLHKFEHDDKGPIPQFYGAGIAFKHPQLIEMVPFFVRSDLQEPEKLYALCRAAHYLRIQPAWVTGNTLLPYPMHLGRKLIEDQLCILETD